MNTVYIETYFLTVACVLGTGCLGLPLTLDKCGFYPFLVIFMSASIIQLLIVVFTVEILQKSHAIQVKCLKEMLNDDTYEQLEDHSNNEGHAILSKENAMRSPNFHFLAELFLGYGFNYVFDVIIIIDMTSLMVVFSLAGSEALGEFLGIKYIYIIPVFIWGLAFIVIFAVSRIKTVISVLTFFKGTLLSLTVVVTLFVTSGGHENASNDFTYIQDSFLLSIVSAGGSIFVMPFLFAKIENDSSQIQKYRLAVLMGLGTCTFLNIIWCWAVFDVVPQHCSPIIERNQSSVICNSLESAKKNGEISTVPLIRIIRHEHPSFLWVAIVVEIFIIISITVSFMTIGTASHHIICGIVEANFPSCSSSLESKRSKNIAKMCTTNFISFILYGIVFVIAMLNPKAFLAVIEKCNTFIANILKIFVTLMFMSSRYKDKKNVEIPLPLPNIFVPSAYLVFLYCVYGIGYDIYISVLPYLHPNNI